MSLQDKALRMGEQGYFVLPLLVRSDGRKLPLIKWGSEAATDATSIAQMPWERATHVAVACEPSGIAVMDLDVYYDDETEGPVEGEELLTDWERFILARGEDNQDNPLMDPPWITTVSGGLHIFLRANPGHPVINTVKDIHPAIDTRGTGGQFGGIVAIYADEMPDIVELPPVPEWLSELTLRFATAHETPKMPPRSAKYPPGVFSTDWGQRQLDWRLDKIAELWDADTGEFNKKLNGLAYGIGQVVAGGEIEVAHAYDAMTELLLRLGAPSDQFKTIDSGFAAGYERPMSAEDVIPATQVTDETVADMASRWLTSEELDEMPPPDWIVPGWFERNSLVQIFGPPKGGKTHIALDLAASLSAGLSWPRKGGAGGDPQRVAYIVAEGASGVAQRKRAWESRHGYLDNMLYYPHPLKIENRGEWLVATRFLSEWKPTMIVIDTQARCTVGVEENSPKEMGMVVECVEQLRQDTGACVVLVHHTSKYGGESGRGTNAMDGALTTGVKVKKAPGNHNPRRFEVTMPLQKNAEEADKNVFELQEVGESVIPVHVHEVAEDISEDVQATNAWMLIRQLLSADPDGEFTTMHVVEQTGLSRSKVSTRLNEMATNGEIHKHQGYGNDRRISVYRWNRNRT